VSHLGEEAEAFFQKGDEGTYEGGPRSLSPSALEAAQEADDLTTELIPELLERRDRFQRIVKTIVGTLGAGVLVLLPFRLGIAGGSSTATVAQVTELPTPGALAMSAASFALAPRHGSAPSVPASETEGASAAGSTPAEHHAVVVSKHAATTIASVSNRAVGHVEHTIARRSAGSPRFTVHTATGATAVSARVPGSHRVTVGHVPPTASFPDLSRTP